MFRLDQEKDVCSFYFWLTLQYSDDYVPRFPDGEMCFSKEHCHGFFEKLRKRYSKDKLTFKHFLVSEYGPNATHRPHYHCLLMVYSDKSLSDLYLIRREMREFILEKAWPYGHVTEKSFHGRVLRYLTKYCLKPELLGQYHTMKPFTLISRGIGLSLLDRIPSHQIEQMKESLDFTYRYGLGKIKLPRYYVDRILPHSLQNLRDLIPDDPSGDWSEYQKLSSVRDRLTRINNHKVNLRALRAAKKYAAEPLKEIKDHTDFVDYELATFRSIIKQRKNL